MTKIRFSIDNCHKWKQFLAPLDYNDSKWVNKRKRFFLESASWSSKLFIENSLKWTNFRKWDICVLESRLVERSFLASLDNTNFEKENKTFSWKLRLLKVENCQWADNWRKSKSKLPFLEIWVWKSKHFTIESVLWLFSQYQDSDVRKKQYVSPLKLRIIKNLSFTTLVEETAKKFSKYHFFGKGQKSSVWIALLGVFWSFMKMEHGTRAINFQFNQIMSKMSTKTEMIKIKSVEIQKRWFSYGDFSK